MDRSTGRLLAALPPIVAVGLATVGAWVQGSRTLDPDVITYQQIAQNLSWQNVYGGLREPIWPLIFYLPVHLLGDHSWIAIRGIGVAGFAFMVIVFQALCNNLLGRTWSVLAALVVAASPWMVWQATRGLREETSAALVLLLVLGLVQPKITARRFILLFGLAAVTGLLRADVMDVMLGALVLALVIRRPRPIVWLAGPAIVVLLIGPQYLANYIQNGDPFYETNVLARFFRNVEFAGQPGFISQAEMQVNSFAGAPVTWTQYVFGMHTSGELLTRAVLAFVIVPMQLTGLVVFFGWRALAPLMAIRTALEPLLVVAAWAVGAVGGLALLRTRAWVVPVIIGGQILMYSPIAKFMDFRLVLDLFPLLLICVGYGLICIVRWTRPGSTTMGLER